MEERNDIREEVEKTEEQTAETEQVENWDARIAYDTAMKFHEERYSDLEKSIGSLVDEIKRFKKDWAEDKLHGWVRNDIDRKEENQIHNIFEEVRIK